MSKLNNFKGNIELISGLTPKNDNDFALLEAHAIQVDEKGTRLDETLVSVDNKLTSLEGAATSDKIFGDERFTKLQSAVNTNTTNIGNNTTKITILNTAINGTDGSPGIESRLTDIEQSIKDGTIGGGSNDEDEHDIYYDSNENILYLYKNENKNSIDDKEYFDKKDFSNVLNENILGKTIIVGGGGGGGGSNGATVTLTTVSSSSQVIAQGSNVILSYIITTKYPDSDELTSLPCSIQYYVNENRVATANTVSTTTNTPTTFDVTKYLVAGQNTVRAAVTCEETTRSIGWSVNYVDVKLSTSGVNETSVYTSSLNINFTVTGSLSKTVYCELDGQPYKQATSSRNPYTSSFTIESQSHGSHTIKLYADGATTTGETIRSNIVRYEILWATEGEKDILIKTDYDESPLEQYTPKTISYLVYDPEKPSGVPVKIYINGELYSEVSVDRTLQSFTYRPLEIGDLEIKLVASGTDKSTEKVYKTTVEALSEDLSEASGKTFDFIPTGKSNNSVDKDVYEYNGYSMTVSKDFDWTNGGWKTDSDGNPCLLIKAGSSISFDYPLFSTISGTSGVKTTGRNFKIIYKTANCKTFNAGVMKCLAGTTTKVGVEIQAQNAYVYPGVSDDNKMVVQYVEDELIELEINIQPKRDDKVSYGATNADNLVVAYLSSDPSKVQRYDANATLDQSDVGGVQPVTIGSPDCDIYLYRFKVYEKSLTDDEILQNYFADALDAPTMKDRYDRNNILDDNGNLDYNVLAERCPDLRVLVVTCPRFPQEKSSKDKISGCTVQHIYKNGSAKDNWTAHDVVIKVQGTSSAAYADSALNFDISCKGAKGFEYVENNQDMTAKKYAMTENSVPVNYFNIKVNVASSENANNAVLADTYNAYQPYSRPSKTGNVRDTMEFHPCAIFIQETDENNCNEFEADGQFHFYACGDFGNSKKNSEAFGMTSDEEECIIEVSNNNNKPTRFLGEFPEPEYDSVSGILSNSFTTDPETGVTTGGSWNGGVFEFRYPDTDDLLNKEVDEDIYSEAQKQALAAIKENETVYNQAQQDTIADLKALEGNQDKSDEEIKALEEYPAKVEEKLKATEEYAQKLAELRESIYQTRKARVDKMINNFKKMWVWTNSTDTTSATNEPLSTPVTYNGVQYTNDTKEYRLAKFVAEYQNYFVSDSILFHYLFTERHTMVDNRAKNTFIHYNVEGPEKGKWDFVFDYDNDTADGNDNSGNLTLDYGLEDTDLDAAGAPVFNGSDSVLWCNVRDGLNTQLKSLVSKAGGTNGTVNIETMLGESDILNRFETYQAIKCERLEMMDMWRKYFRPAEGYLAPKGFRKDNANADGSIQSDNYLKMMYGKKTLQRRRFNKYQSVYCNSKYSTKTAKGDHIWIRTSVPPADTPVTVDNTFRITPYSSMYVNLDLDTRVLQVKAKAGETVEIKVPDNITFQDIDSYIYNQSFISDIGDLSQFYLKKFVIDNAKKLKRVVLGSPLENYSNQNLDEISLKNAPLIEELDVRNMGVGNLDLSSAYNLQKAYTTGSSAQTITFANGGALKVAELNAVTGLTVRNLTQIESFSLASYDGLIRLVYENCPNLNLIDLLTKATNLSRIGLFNVDLTLEDSTLLNRLAKMTGIDENGNEKTTSVLTGKITILSGLRKSEKELYQKLWNAGTSPNDSLYLDIRGTDIPEYTVNFYDSDGEDAKIVYTVVVEQYNSVRNELGGDPLELGLFSKPIKEQTDQFTYTFTNWRNPLNTSDSIDTPIDRSIDFYPVFLEKIREYEVIWQSSNASNATIYARQTVPYGTAAIYPESNTLPTKDDVTDSSGIITKTYVFDNWDKSTNYVTGPMIVTPIFEEGKYISDFKDLDATTFTAADTLLWAKNFKLNKITVDNVIGDEGFLSSGTTIPVQMGYMPDFSNIESKIIVGEGGNYNSIKLDGQTCVEINDVKLFDKDKDFVFALDFTSGYKKYTSGQETNANYFYNTIMSMPQDGLSSLSMTIRLEGNGSPQFVVPSATKQQISPFRPSLVTDTGTGAEKRYYEPRQIIVVQHKKGQQGLTIYYQERNSQVQMTTINFSATLISNVFSNSSLYFGAIETNASEPAYGYGEINYCKIWYGDLGENECKKIASWTYEIRNFTLGSYRGYRGYNQETQGVGDSISFTFVDTNLLDVTYPFDNINVLGGFKYSEIRKFLNTTVYKGMNPKWRSIIKLVEVNSRKGGSKDGLLLPTDKDSCVLFPGDKDTKNDDNTLNMSDIIPSMNYLFTPSYFEIDSSSAGSSYANEVLNDTTKFFRTFTAQETRAKTISSWLDPKTKTPLNWCWLTRTPASGQTYRVFGVNYTGAVASSGSYYYYQDGASVSNALDSYCGVLMCFCV
jgi:hypothetical protein